MSNLEVRKKDGSAFRFLLVDDSDFILKALRVTVKLLGGEVVGEASDGIQAVELYKKTRPDLVTCDIVMPNMGGVEVVQALQSIDPASNIVMASSLGHQDIVKKAIDAGAKYFIVKPFKPAEAAVKLRTLLEKLYGLASAA
ncbi:MAG: response regulator [Vulcanimicrobiota bacterium]